MAHALVVECHAFVGTMFVGVDRGARRGMIGHKALQRLRVWCLDNLCLDIIRGPILCTGDDELTNVSAPGPQFLLAMFVLLKPTEVCLVDLNWTGQFAAVVSPCFTDSVRHEPCGLLPDAQLTVQLH